jgi:uncharacterized protein (DUF1697 family)
MQYITLLRGINVGGNNKIPMPLLQATLEKNKMTEVTTYINSGNVIFTSKHKDSTTANAQVEEIIKATFDLEIRAITYTSKEFIKVTESIKPKWANDDDQKTDIMFLWPEIDNPKIVEELEINKSFETLDYFPGVLFWNIKRAFVNSSRLDKLVGTRKYKFMTVRNVNTVRKLLDLLSRQESDK